MRFDSQYKLEQLDTLGVFTFGDGANRRHISFYYEVSLGIPDDLHDDATALFTNIAKESRKDK